MNKMVCDYCGEIEREDRACGFGDYVPNAKFPLGFKADGYLKDYRSYILCRRCRDYIAAQIDMGAVRPEEVEKVEKKRGK